MLLSVIIVETKCFDGNFNLSFPIGFDRFKYVGVLDLNAIESKLNRRNSCCPSSLEYLVVSFII